jgi:hypothetical protein
MTVMLLPPRKLWPRIFGWLWIVVAVLGIVVAVVDGLSR